MALEKLDTPILAGMRIYHNFVKPHMALEGKTPADIAGISVHGEKKWLTLIQNTSVKNKPATLTEDDVNDAN